MTVSIIVRQSTHKYTGTMRNQPIGKAGRQARMFAKSRKIKDALERCIVPHTRTERAVELSRISQREPQMIDVANYRCTQGKPCGTNTVRAKQKRRLGVKEPRI